MSKIGKKAIIMPAGAVVKTENDLIIVKGPKGELKQKFDSRKFKIEIEEVEGKKMIKVVLVKENRDDYAIWGLLHALLSNMMIGVTQGFEKRLELRGIGFKVALQGKTLVFNLGFSHTVEVVAPAGIDFAVDKNIVIVKGIDKHSVGQIAAIIRSKRKPEPYQGKGIRYEGERVKQKVGKKSVASAK